MAECHLKEHLMSTACFNIVFPERNGSPIPFAWVEIWLTAPPLPKDGYLPPLWRSVLELRFIGPD